MGFLKDWVRPVPNLVHENSRNGKIWCLKEFSGRMLLGALRLLLWISGPERSS